MPTQTVSIGELIADKIKVRYAEITHRTMGSTNMVVDAFYPTYVRQSLVSGMQAPALGKKCSAISPFVASELGVYQIPIEDLTSMLGYKKIEIKKMLEAVKAKKIELVLAGLGGTGMNFMHWATELCNYTNTVNVFEEILIYDQDSVDLTNIFRFPQSLNPGTAYSDSGSNMYKIQMISSASILSRKEIQKRFQFITAGVLSILITRDFNEDGKLVSVMPRREIRADVKDKVFYGAPDIESREMFAEFPEVKFVSGTHGNDDCQLFIKPVQDSSIQIESYGMINLSIFFMNQLKLTLSFLELLASDTDLTQSNLIMEYSFSKEYANGRINKAGMNRTYNFPILASNFIDQEANMPDEVEEVVEQPEPQTIALPDESIPAANPPIAPLDLVFPTLRNQTFVVSGNVIHPEEQIFIGAQGQSFLIEQDMIRFHGSQSYVYADMPQGWPNVNDTIDQTTIVPVESQMPLEPPVMPQPTVRATVIAAPRRRRTRAQIEADNLAAQEARAEARETYQANASI